mgnify:CR=1 FL=1
MSLATPKHVERRQAASFMVPGTSAPPTFSQPPARGRGKDTLRVRVLSGADLKDDMDVTGAGDPYVVLGVDDGPTQKTSACACTANPSWGDGELFEFELPSDDCELRLQVWDADLVGSDDEMGDGSMRVSLQQLALIGSFYVNVRISLGGTIRLQARARARNSAAQFGAQLSGAQIRRRAPLTLSIPPAAGARLRAVGARGGDRGGAAAVLLAQEQGAQDRRQGATAARGAPRFAILGAIRAIRRTALTSDPSHFDRSPRRSG